MINILIAFIFGLVCGIISIWWIFNWEWQRLWEFLADDTSYPAGRKGSLG